MDLNHAAQADSQAHQRKSFPPLRTQGRRGTISSTSEPSLCSWLGVNLKSSKQLQRSSERARTCHASSFIQAYVLSRGFILVRSRGADLLRAGRAGGKESCKQGRQFCKTPRCSSKGITHRSTNRQNFQGAVTHPVPLRVCGLGDSASAGCYSSAIASRAGSSRPSTALTARCT